MNRYAGVFVLCCSLLATATAAPAATGFSFDQVSISTVQRPLPQEAEFDRVWSAELALLKTHASESWDQIVPKYGQALSTAILGDWIRTENPVSETVVIQRPDLHEVISLYPDKKYFVYHVATNTHDVYSVTSGGPPQPAPPASAPAATATLRVTRDVLPATTFGDFAENGFSERIVQSVNAPAPCKFAQQVAAVTVLVLPQFKEPVLTSDSYGAPMNFAGYSLSRISGCNVTVAADFMSAFPTYPSFILYKTTTSATASQDLSQMPFPPELPVNVLMRGHIKKLGDADKKLFEIPQGYTQTMKRET